MNYLHNTYHKIRNAWYWILGYRKPKVELRVVDESPLVAPTTKNLPTMIFSSPKGPVEVKTVPMDKLEDFFGPVSKGIPKGPCVVLCAGPRADKITVERKGDK